MFIIRLIRYFFGYVQFEIYGKYPERLINILSHRGVSVWGVSRRAGHINACVAIRDYKRLHTLKGKCRLRVRHRQTCGLWIRLYAYRDKVGFAVGIAAFFLIIKLLSLYIWQIEIVGNTYIEPQRIYAALEKVGVSYGARRSAVDAFNVDEQLVLELPELAWAAVNIEGSRVTVELSEVRQVPQQQAHTPCNLVARLDGRIVGHRVTEGRLAVKVGDPVVRGDLLVSGILEYKNGTSGLKHASGAVIAETRHTACWFEPYSGTVFERTGRIQRKCVLELFGLHIPLYLGSTPYPYEAEYQQTPLTIAGVRLPIVLYEARFYEVRERDYTLSAAQAEQRARKQIENITKSELPDIEILNKTEKVNNQNDGICIEYLYICHENIALEEILSISTINF